MASAPAYDIPEPQGPLARHLRLVEDTKPAAFKPRDLTLDECRAIVGNTGVDFGIFGSETPDRLAAAMFGIAGKRPGKVGEAR